MFAWLIEKRNKLINLFRGTSPRNAGIFLCGLAVCDVLIVVLQHPLYRRSHPWWLIVLEGLGLFLVSFVVRLFWLAATIESYLPRWFLRGFNNPDRWRLRELLPWVYAFGLIAPLLAFGCLLYAQPILLLAALVALAVLFHSSLWDQCVKVYDFWREEERYLVLAAGGAGVLVTMVWYHHGVVMRGVEATWSFLKVHLELILWVLVGLIAVTLVTLEAARIKKRKEEKARAEEEAAKKQKALKEAEARAVVARAKAEKNKEREDQRNKFFQENPPQIFTHSIAGITIALTPKAYERCRKVTNYAVMDGRWYTDALLMPTEDEMYVFVTKEGEERIIRALHSMGKMYVRERYVSGWLSELEDLIKTNNMRREKDPAIFVPWASEAFFAYRLQERWLVGEKATKDLVESQAPQEMRTIE